MFIQRYFQFWFFKERFGTSFPTTFCAWISRKIFLMFFSIDWPNFIVWFPLLLEISGNQCIVIVCWLFSYWLFSYITIKFRTKLEISQEGKGRLRWDKNHFLSFKGFQLVNIAYDLRVCLYNKVIIFNTLKTIVSLL